jgi:hypothetical protein
MLRTVAMASKITLEEMPMTILGLQSMMMMAMPEVCLCHRSHNHGGSMLC